MIEYINQTIKILTDGTDEQVLEILEASRDNGSLQLIPHLIDLLLISKNDEIKKDIIAILNDLKDDGASKIIVAAMKDAKYQSILSVLVECCWQNGLNYSHDVDFFVNLVINGDFKLSFDAFTVVENMDHTYDETTSKYLISNIKDSILTVEHDRKLLLASLIDLL